MHYLGSKARHAADIIAFTQSKRKPGQTYVEPFVGGGNMMNRVPADIGPRIGNDYNFHMVQLLDQLGNHSWLPPETMTEQEWNLIAKTKPPTAVGPEAALYAFAAIGPTFGSVWFGAWVKEGDRYQQARNGAIKDQPGLVGVQFFHAQNGGGDYRNLTINNLIPPESVIYCDPPYEGTTGYAGAKETIKVDEDSNKNIWKARTFWQWADALVDAGHTVYVSEYKAPIGGDIYATLPASAAEKETRAQIAALQKDPNSSSTDIAERNDRLMEFKIARNAEAIRLAARWQVLWEKEVIADFSSNRDAGKAISGKKETEKLFHRAA